VFVFVFLVVTLAVRFDFGHVTARCCDSKFLDAMKEYKSDV
jgi:hypothetical protein